MTRRKWSEVRDAHLRTPEDRARYERARVDLEAELAEDGIEILEEDQATPAGHAWLDQFLAEHSKGKPVSDEEPGPVEFFEALDQTEDDK